MTFGTFPVALQNAIQAGFLERAFVDPLINKLAYRKIADKEILLLKYKTFSPQQPSISSPTAHLPPERVQFVTGMEYVDFPFSILL